MELNHIKYQWRIQRLGRGAKKHEIYATTFGGHLFVTYFYSAGGRGDLALPLDPLLNTGNEKESLNFFSSRDDADRILDLAKRVIELLEEAERAQNTAQDAINDALRDITNAQSGLALVSFPFKSHTFITENIDRSYEHKNH